jgi:pimeloyl-ACP methyl ester carboxylesterase/DNA-binding winged helix-turn-helix (wHTH) protein
MRYRFGSHLLVPRTRELVADGAAVAIEPQVFDLLLTLIERRDRVVATDELLSLVWGGRVVSESAIAARISAARAAVADDGTGQRVIRTIRRRGFRFVAEVAVEDDAAVGRRDGDEPQRPRTAFCRSADGTRIAWSANGSGPPVIKVGHWLTHLEHDRQSPIWRPWLDALEARVRLVRYDQRGNGLSDRETADFALDRFVEDLEAVVEASGYRRFALYGTSQGVPVAIAYAVRHPEQVGRLILQGGFARGRMVRGSAREREQAAAILTLIRGGWGEAGSAFLAAFASLFVPTGTREQLDSLAELQRLTTTAETAALLREAFDRFDVYALLEKVVAPTLVIHARGDAVQPLAEGRELATGIAGAEFVLLDSANHVPLTHDPSWDANLAAIVRFAADPETS